jgi:membrane protease YdiL (CAAX protease family)
MFIEVPYLVGALEVLLSIAGAVLAWRLILSPAARSQRAPARLAPWNVLPADFALFLFSAFGGAIVAGLVLSAVQSKLGLKGDQFTLVATAASQFGMLAGLAGFARLSRQLDLAVPEFTTALSTGLIAFLIALPFVIAGGALWAGLIKLSGLPEARQPAVELFARLKGPWIAFMAVTAGVVAPVCEELLFRAGVFRYLRTRIPRWAALLLPASLFAAMHFDLTTYVQLVVLGIVFALAYERTGNLGTAMVAHALFNLNSMLMLLAGVMV